LFLFIVVIERTTITRTVEVIIDDSGLWRIAIERTMSSSSNNKNKNTNKSNATGTDTYNPRIRRRTSAAKPNRQKQSNDAAPNSNKTALRLDSLADFQDGKRFSPEENTSILQDVTQTFHKVSTKLGFLQSAPTNNAKLESAMNRVRLEVGLYRNFPLAHNALSHSQKRVAALKENGQKQMDHVRATDGWWRTLLVVDERAIDNYLGPWLLICSNALLACLLVEVWGKELPKDSLEHWDTVYALVLKTSLAFLLVFRLNRCAMRYWEARGLWGNLTHKTRNLVGALLMYGTHSPKHRDAAIRWGSAFCVASKNFIRSETEVCPHELAGFLSAHHIGRLREASHGPLLAASMCRHYLEKLFRVDEHTAPGLAHAYSLRLQECQSYVTGMVEQVSGMEKIRSTPLPIAYVAHLRTFLILYCLFLPYVWVHEWSWATIPLTAFTAFALLGIEGASSEVEIPFSKTRSNHLAMEAYCLVILESVTELVVNDANLHMQGRKGRDTGLWKRNVGFGGGIGEFFSDSDEDEDNDEDEDDTKGTEETARGNLSSSFRHEDTKVDRNTIPDEGTKGESLV